MKRCLMLAYALIAYTLSLGTFAYLIGFVGDLVVPKSIDRGTPAPSAEALIVNTALVVLFGVQHSVMARQRFKRWWTRVVPRPIERSTYLLATCLALIALFWQWRPMPAIVWDTAHPAWVGAAYASFFVGWTLAFAATFLLDHLELFGLRQALAASGEHAPPPFRTPLLYRYVRHPIYLGFLLALWSTPRMTVGHLLFAAGMTGYVMVGARLEERDLIVLFGERYRRYRERVRMLLPLPRGARPRTPPRSTAHCRARACPRSRSTRRSGTKIPGDGSTTTRPEREMLDHGSPQ